MSRLRLSYSLLTAAVIALGAAGQANANVLLNIDFDTHPAASTYSYKYAGGGSGGGDVTTTGAVTIGAGVGGSTAYSSTTDSTGANKGAGSYWGAGDAATNTASTVTVAPSASDLTYSVDVDGLGVKSATAALRIQMRFYDSVTNTMLWQTRNTPTYTTPGQFQTFTGNLGSSTTLAGSYANMIASPNPMKIEFTVEASNGAGNFGYDTDNVLTIDNITVSDVGTAVPEPASLGLLAVAGLGLVARRRR